MTNSIDVAWNVAKGEPFHSSVAGYMSRATPADDQFGAPVAGRVERSNADALNRKLSPTGVRPSMKDMQGDRSKTPEHAMDFHKDPNAPAVGPTGEIDEFAHLTDAQTPVIHTYGFSGFNDPMKERLFAMRDTDSPQRISPEFYPEESGMDFRIDRMNPPSPLNERYNKLFRRSSDSPIDTAWSILKALSREDLEMAARTGGVPRMSGTMRPEFYGRPNFMDEEEPPVDMMTPLSPSAQALPTEPRFSGPRTEQADIQQQYNELIFPDEEAEQRRINAPTPVSTPGVGDPNLHILQQRLQDMEYPLAQMRAAGMHPETHLPMRDLMQERMTLMHRIGQRPPPIPGVPLPIDEAGDASMPDPSQMEHLGAQLAHADMMRDDVAFADRVRGDELPAGFVDWLPNLQSTADRAPNRAALSELGTNLNTNEIMSRIMNGEQVSDEELMSLSRVD